LDAFFSKLKEEKKQSQNLLAFESHTHVDSTGGVRIWTMNTVSAVRVVVLDALFLNSFLTKGDINTCNCLFSFFQSTETTMAPTSKRTKCIHEAEDDRKLPALPSENEEEESDDEGESTMYDSEDEESADEDASAMYENDEDESDDDVEIYASDEDNSADASNMSESDVVDTIQVKSLTPSHIIVATDELAEAMIQFSE
jgi:hypothetical protein